MRIEISLGDGKGSTAAVIGLVASALAAIGSVAPWASIVTVFGTINVSGTSGDGTITLVFAIAAMFWLIRYLIADSATTGTLVWVTVLFAGMFGVAAYHSYNLGTLVEPAAQGVAVNKGWGLTVLWMVSLAGMIDLAVASYQSWKHERQTPTTSTEQTSYPVIQAHNSRLFDYDEWKTRQQH